MPDLREIAINAARQMQGPKDGAIICSFDRAVEIISDALKFAAGQRRTQFAEWGGARKARTCPRKAPPARANASASGV
jgi:hypothetical protein